MKKKLPILLSLFVFTFQAKADILPIIFFSPGTSTLLKNEFVNSADSLNYLADIMEANPDVNFALTMHVDSRINNERMNTLVVERYNKCVNHLESKGIDKNRLRMIYSPNKGALLLTMAISPFKAGSELTDEFIHNLSSEALKEKAFNLNNSASINIYSVYNNNNQEKNNQNRGESLTDNGGKTLNNNEVGDYYALIIGVEEYLDIQIKDLDLPIDDASQLYDILTNYYTFDPSRVILLKNATEEQIIESFDVLSQKITPTDNLLIFYAGHGFWDSEKKLGYWLPSDATQRNTAKWILNSAIRDYISSIQSKHTLLISDACFSGSIFKRSRNAFENSSPYVQELYRNPSRKAMTSGNLSEVPDKSVFTYFLIKRLTENTKQFLPASDLFYSFSEEVSNNTTNSKGESITPLFGTIDGCGTDDGGQFIFIRR
jgi:hypothetical protein